MSLHDSILSLSERQAEVFELYGHGYSTRQIAARMDISVKTVETHVEAIKAKTGLPTLRSVIIASVRKNAGAASLI